jgi:hypothetical protein
MASMFYTVDASLLSHSSFYQKILEPLEIGISGVIDIAAGGPFSIILKGKRR